MKRKQFWLALLIGIVAFGMLTVTQVAAGPGGQKTADGGEKKYTIMYVAPKVNDPVWLIVKAGFDAAAKEFGFNGIWTGADDHTVERTVEALENTVVQRPDAIVCCPFAPSAFTTALRNAKNAGIVVTTSAVDAANEDLRAAFVGTDNANCGIVQAQEIVKRLPRGATVNLGIIMSNIDSENQVIQWKAAEKYFKDNNIPYRIVDTRADNADPNTSVEVVKTMLQANPQINAILSCEGGGSPGVGKAIEELGLAGKIVAITMDATELNLDQVKKGNLTGVMAQNLYGGWGYDAARFAYMALRGEQVPSFTDSGVQLVDRAAAATFNPNSNPSKK
jgi:ABC-type sugar transport system substrate-binding protein